MLNVFLWFWPENLFFVPVIFVCFFSFLLLLCNIILHQPFVYTRQGLRSGGQTRYHKLACSRLTFTRHSPYNPAVCLVWRNRFIWQDWSVCWWQTDKQFYSVTMLQLRCYHYVNISWINTLQSTVLVNSTDIPCVSVWKYATIGVTWGRGSKGVDHPNFIFELRIVFGYWVKEGQIKIYNYFRNDYFKWNPCVFSNTHGRFRSPPQTPPPPSSVIGQDMHMYSTV
jgi:hypothetical protein